MNTTKMVSDHEQPSSVASGASSDGGWHSNHHNVRNVYVNVLLRRTIRHEQRHGCLVIDVRNHCNILDVLYAGVKFVFM